MPPEGSDSRIESWVWICDFVGFGLRDAIDPRFSIWLINMLQVPPTPKAFLCARDSTVPRPQPCDMSVAGPGALPRKTWCVRHHRRTQELLHPLEGGQGCCGQQHAPKVCLYLGGGGDKHVCGYKRFESVDTSMLIIPNVPLVQT